MLTCKFPGKNEENSYLILKIKYTFAKSDKFFLTYKNDLKYETWNMNFRYCQITNHSIDPKHWSLSFFFSANSGTTRSFLRSHHKIEKTKLFLDFVSVSHEIGASNNAHWPEPMMAQKRWIAEFWYFRLNCFLMSSFASLKFNY